MRKHNFELGNSKVNQRSSTYNQAYQPSDPEIYNQGPSKAELKQKMLDLRNTHLVLGQDPKNMVTTMKNDFSKRENPNTMAKLDRVALQQSHFHLGNQVSDMESMNRMSYVTHKHGNEDIEAEKERLMADLRSNFLFVNKKRAPFQFWGPRSRLWNSAKNSFQST